MVMYEKYKEIEKPIWILFKRLLPFILAVVFLKLAIWYLEANYGFQNPDITGVLTIIGIVLGLILATQLPFAVSKYKEANDNLDNTRAILWTLGNLMIRENFKKKDRNEFIESARDWLEHYRGYLKDRNSKEIMIKKFREFSMKFKIFKKYKLSAETIARIEEWNCQMSRFMSGEDSLKTIRTPKAYYEVMLIGIFSYVIGVVFTYSGFVGVLVGMFASFLFGGMYVLAVDFDDPFGYSKGEIVDVDIDTPISDGQKYIGEY